MSGMIISIVWGAYCLLLALAAIQDFRSLKIANILSVGVLLVALVQGLAAPGPTAFWEHLASFAVVLAGGTLLFTLGWFGGGDAKLFAASAAWFGLSDVVWFVAGTLMAGALLTVLMLGGRLLLPLPDRGSWQSMRRERSIPYGVAIAVTAIIFSYPGFA